MKSRRKAVPGWNSSAQAQGQPGISGLSGAAPGQRGARMGRGRGWPWRVLQTPLRNGDLMETAWRYLRVSLNLSLKLSLTS